MTDLGFVQQILAELNEARGQLENARACIETIGLQYRPHEYCTGGHASIKDGKAHKEIAAHRMREAIGNLKDCLRFIDEEQP